MDLRDMDVVCLGDTIHFYNQYGLVAIGEIDVSGEVDINFLVGDIN